MPTTTIRIEDDLKDRVSAAARRLGKTPHAFMVEAIAGKVEEVEHDEALARIVEERWAAFLRTGEAVPADAMADWIRARIRGDEGVKPKVRRVRS